MAVLANVLLYAVVVFPLGRQVVSAEAEANTQHELLNRARQDHRAAKATVTGKQQADAALQKFYKDVLPASQSAARTLTYTRLSQLAEQANVRLEQGANTIEHEKGSTLVQVDDALHADGRLPRCPPVHLLPRDDAGVHRARKRHADLAGRADGRARPRDGPRHRDLLPVGQCRKLARSNGRARAVLGFAARGRWRPCWSMRCGPRPARRRRRLTSRGNSGP